MTAANLIEIFCILDEFCKYFTPELKKHLVDTSGKRRRNRPCRLSDREVMTILVLFHAMHFRDLKSFYLGYVCQHMRKDFPHTASVFLLPAQEVAPATDDDALRPVEGLQRCGEVTQTGHVSGTHHLGQLLLNAEHLPQVGCAAVGGWLKERGQDALKGGHLLEGLVVLLYLPLVIVVEPEAASLLP